MTTKSYLVFTVGSATVQIHYCGVNLDDAEDIFRQQRMLRSVSEDIFIEVWVDGVLSQSRSNYEYESGDYEYESGELC